MEKTYRTAIYARLSREDLAADKSDAAESNSIVSQKAICEEYISQRPELDLTATFSDDGYSGVSFERPNFKRMEQAVRDGRIDCIVCKDLSRFSRNYIEAGRYLEKIFPSSVFASSQSTTVTIPPGEIRSRIHSLCRSKISSTIPTAKISQ